MTWPLVPIAEVTRIVSGATPRTGKPSYWDGDISWATPKDISDLDGSKYLRRTPRTLTTEGLSACSAEVLPPNSVLFSSRAPIGLVAINSIPVATNQGFKSFIPDPARLDAGYLYYWLKANRPSLERLGVGATFKEVSKAIVSRIQIPLPPLAEQRRIAAILDQAEELRSKRRAAIALLDQIPQAIFHEMFGDPATNPMGWPIRCVGDLLESANYGTSGKAGGVGNWPILRMGNLTTEGHLDLSELKYIDLSPTEVPKYTVEKGDILFNRTNSSDLVGKTALYNLDQTMAYAGYLVRLRVADKAVPEFLAAFMNLAYTKKVLRGMAKSIVGMANINAKEVQTITLPVPDVELQSEFANRVEAIHRTKAAHRDALAEIDALFDALRASAFGSHT